MSATLTTSETQSVLQLDWSNVGGTVTITPRDNDRFVMRVERAIEACKAGIERDRFRRQFDFLLKRVATWLTTQDEIREAYVTIQDGRILILAVLKSAAYIRSFEDEFTEFQFALIDDPELQDMNLDVMALPSVSIESLGSFLGPNMICKLAGKRESADGQ